MPNTAPAANIARTDVSLALCAPFEFVRITLPAARVLMARCGSPHFANAIAIVRPAPTKAY
jgi:hypothetical protein